MSSNIEFALISAIIANKDFHTANKLQINEGFFASPETREVYRFLRNTYFDSSTHGQGAECGDGEVPLPILLLHSIT